MSRTADTALPLLDPRNSSLDRWAFFVLAVSGSVAIVVLRNMPIDPLWIVPVPLGAIVLYALIVLITGRFRLREDRAADNCYYMGFIFTLVSLAYALYTFRVGGEATDGLIHDFGIALVSTIVGVAARLLLNQFRTDPVEIEREARLDLAETAQKLRSQLQQSVVEFQNYQISLQQSLREAMMATSEQTEKSLESTTDRFEAVSTALLDRIDHLFEAHEANASKLTQASGRTVDALESLVRRIEEVEAPRDLIEQALSPAVQEIRSAAEAVGKRARSEGQQIKRLTSLVENALAAGEALEKRITTAADHAAAEADRYERFLSTIDGLRQRMSEGSEGLRSSQELIGRMAEEARTSLDSIRRHNEAIRSEVEDGRSATLDLHRDLAQYASLIIERLGSEPRPERGPPPPPGVGPDSAGRR